VLPGEADAAEGVDAVLGDRERGLHAGRPGDGGGQRRLARVGAGLLGAGGVPGAGAGLLGAGQHPGAAVLDALELADRAAELLAYLGVLGGGGGAPLRQPRRLGGEQHRRQVQHVLRAQAGQDGVLRNGHGVGRDLRRTPGRIVAEHVDDPYRLARQNDPRRGVAPGSIRQHRIGRSSVGQHSVGHNGGEDEDVGDLAAEHRFVHAVHDRPAALARQRQPAGTQADGTDHGALGESFKVRPVVGGPVIGSAAVGGSAEDGAGERGGQERAGGEHAAQFLGHHGQLDQAEAAAARVLRQVQPEQPLLGERLPERGDRVTSGVHGRAHGLGRHVPGREGAHRVAQVAMLLGQSDGHVRLSSARRWCRCRKEHPGED
jgi:hypothetical protein